jgi:putative iron-only hydrogenase system regulator
LICSAKRVFAVVIFGHIMPPSFGGIFLYNKEKTMKRIGVIGIVVKGDRAVAVEMQKVLSEFGDIIIGRMGVPRPEANVISIIVEGSVERVSALTGRLGKFQDLAVKSALTSVEIDD